MLDVARLSEKDRCDLFRVTAQRMRVDPAIIEKDFWVCWVLDYLFRESPWKDALAFKGGTSLSKAFNIIERFSEDIDLILDWRLLGYSADEPWAHRSNKAQDAFGKEAIQRTADFILKKILPVLEPTLKDRAGAPLEILAKNESLFLHYPKSFSLSSVLPQIKLEFGPMAEFVPNENRAIRPYAAEHFPTPFRRVETSVRTVSAERTFWEKATILHQEAHRPATKPLPSRYSRHYYDLFKLTQSPFKGIALAKPDLLKAVVNFKNKFYHCAWANYEDARPGHFKLLPSQAHSDDLKRDYRAMEAMLFGEVPQFELIIETLTDLQTEINFKPNLVRKDG